MSEKMTLPKWIEIHRNDHGRELKQALIIAWEELEEAQYNLHSEFCGMGHHAVCKRVKDAMRRIEELGK